MFKKIILATLLYAILLNTITSDTVFAAIDNQDIPTAAEFDTRFEELLNKNPKLFGRNADEKLAYLLKDTHSLEEFMESDPILKKYYLNANHTPPFDAQGNPAIESHYWELLSRAGIFSITYGALKEEIKKLATNAPEYMEVNHLPDIYVTRDYVDYLSRKDATAKKFAIYPQSKDGYTSLIIAKPDTFNRAQVAFFIDAVTNGYTDYMHYLEYRFNLDNYNKTTWSYSAINNIADENLRTDLKKIIDKRNLITPEEEKILSAATKTYAGQTYGEKIPFIDVSFNLHKHADEKGSHKIYILALTKGAINFLKENPTALDELCNQGKFEEAAKVLHKGMKAHLPYYKPVQTVDGIKYKKITKEEILDYNLRKRCKILHNYSSKK